MSLSRYALVAWSICISQASALEVPIRFTGQVQQMDEPLAAVFPIGTTLEGSFGVSLNYVVAVEGPLLSSRHTYWDITSVSLAVGNLVLEQSEGQILGWLHRDEGKGLSPGQVESPLYQESPALFDAHIGQVLGPLEDGSESEENTEYLDLGNGGFGRFAELGESVLGKYSLTRAEFGEQRSVSLLHIYGEATPLNLVDPFWPDPQLIPDYRFLRGEIAFRTLQSDGAWRNSRAQFEITSIQIIPEPASLSLFGVAIVRLLMRRRYLL